VTDDMIDLDGVRRGDKHLAEAKRLHDEQGQKHRPVPAQEIAEMAEQTFTTEEVADLLDVDIQTVRRWCREGELTAAKMGRNYRISRPDLEAFYRSRGGGELFDERRFIIRSPTLENDFVTEDLEECEAMMGKIQRPYTLTFVIGGEEGQTIEFEPLDRDA